MVLRQSLICSVALPLLVLVAGRASADGQLLGSTQAEIDVPTGTKWVLIHGTCNGKVLKTARLELAADGKGSEKTAMWESGFWLSTDGERRRREAVFRVSRQVEPSGVHGILSRGAITVSPYWYIRGVTPHCRIRRW